MTIVLGFCVLAVAAVRLYFLDETCAPIGFIGEVIGKSAGDYQIFSFHFRISFHVAICWKDWNVPPNSVESVREHPNDLVAVSGKLRASCYYRTRAK
jgi:hypothetical protein